MNECDAVRRLVPDYVLELLSSRQRERVARHAAGCPGCREAISQELRLAQLVRLTLHEQGNIDRRRLAQLQPAAPARRQPGVWQKQLAAAMAAAVMLLSGWGLWQGKISPIWASPAATLYAAESRSATVTVTEAPAVSAARAQTVPAGNAEITAAATAALGPALSGATPAPNPTPILVMTQPAP